MRFIIVRHGEAEHENEDDRRKLTAKGRKEADSVGRYLKNTNINPRYIIHSGKQRSLESALRISEILDVTDRLHFEKNAGPDGDLHDIMDIVMNAEESVILVSHIPLVNRISNFVLSDINYGTTLRFDTGTVLILDRETNINEVNITKDWTIHSFFKPLDQGF